MKFLCEQCKAKYQIADDKVAGKTVRMKCRKCGFMIEVSADVTETSVAQGLPEEKQKGGGGPPRPQAKTALASSLTGRPPAAPKGKPDALAGAFQRKVRQEPESTASLEMLDTAATNGWYVAINGVPVGPVRVSELRRKAANGAINEDSLVWREGLEEWRPVRSVTEIAEIVREAMQSGRPSLVTPPPADVRGSTPPPPGPSPSVPPRPPARPHAPRAPEPPRAAPLAARSNVVPFTGRHATAEKRDELEDIEIDEEPEPVLPPPTAAAAGGERPSMVAADPFAPTAVAFAAPGAASSPLAAPGAASAPMAPSPFAAPMVAAAPEAPRKGSVNPVVVGMFLAFVAFGITGALVYFRQPAPQPQAAPQPVIVQVPVPAAPTTTPMNVAQTPEPTPTEKQPERVASKGTSGTKSTTPTPSPPTGTKGIAGDLVGLGGPEPKVGGGATPTKTGGALSSQDVENTVRNYQTGVKRTCWERSNSQVSSVNITATVTVASTGQVQSVKADGNEPTVAKCIENQVHGWRFPPSGETTTVNIPFKFLRQ